jgi:hypothetical protein
MKELAFLLGVIAATSAFFYWFTDNGIMGCFS